MDDRANTHVVCQFEKDRPPLDVKDRGHYALEGHGVIIPSGLGDLQAGPIIQFRDPPAGQ